VNEVIRPPGIQSSRRNESSLAALIGPRIAGQVKLRSPAVPLNRDPPSNVAITGAILVLHHRLF
jgi:hypothetical protein